MESTVVVRCGTKILKDGKIEVWFEASTATRHVEEYSFILNFDLADQLSQNLSVDVETLNNKHTTMLGA